LKFGTVVVLDRLSKPIDFGFKRSSVRIRVRVRVVACRSKINIIPREKFTPHLNNALSNGNINGISVTLRTTVGP